MGGNGNVGMTLTDSISFLLRHTHQRLEERYANKLTIKRRQADTQRALVSFDASRVHEIRRGEKG